MNRFEDLTAEDNFDAAEQIAAIFAQRRAEVIFRVASERKKGIVQRIEHTVAMRRIMMAGEVIVEEDTPAL